MLDGCDADAMGFVLEGPVLDGTRVRLEPSAPVHAAGLAAAGEEDRASYNFTWVPGATEVIGYIEAQLGRKKAGRLAPYAQIDKGDGPGRRGDVLLGSAVVAGW